MNYGVALVSLMVTRRISRQAVSLHLN